MTVSKPEIKMPELPVFARSFVTGLIGAEIFRLAFYLGTNFAPTLASTAILAKAGAIIFVAFLCVFYAIKRHAHVATARMWRSHRIDLLIAFGIGVWTNFLVSPWLSKLHVAFKAADPKWAPALLLLLCAVLLSPLVSLYRLKPRRPVPQMYFIADDEIEDKKNDLLESEAQARSFAETVIASGAHAGLVFGVDGPWGVGKTSFINLAAHYWKGAEEKVIVCRFEPLRYASEADLSERLIRDLSAAIQREVFAPEFRPAASRYSRLIKGKADVSFLGFKLTLEPSQGTVDDLLEDIDDVLKRIDRRAIIVIDDLDRLDAKSVNNVLFATRRTFKLSQATYVLCYDTELLVRGNEEGSMAREFLEKFVTVKLSLFVDSSSIRDFLRRDWERADAKLGSIPSDTMLKLGAVLNELASILDGDDAAKYLPFVGDMRKVKRFVNAMLLMQLEKSDLGRTDFNKRDLINLILLHLNYPGIFRRIYAEETEGRSGTFSVRREYGTREFKNSSGFINLLEEQNEAVRFLLEQLFDVQTLGLGSLGDVDDAVLASRACFNQDSFRNLEAYLKLIVRFVTPEPRKTFILYKDAVERVKNGETIASVLMSDDFDLGSGEHAHDQFWGIIVNEAHGFTGAIADDAIDSIVDFLPLYSTIGNGDRGLRQRSIYSLLRLLDRAGWGRTSGRRLPNSPENVIEIAWRIFGEHSYAGKGLLHRLADSSRGVLGWNDLMLFRLQCSADRQGQLYNLHTALIVHQDKDAATTGLITDLALRGMRFLSQEVFALFKKTYIDAERNFLSEVDDETASAFLGHTILEEPISKGGMTPDQQVSAQRTVIKSFVIYQLSNGLPPNGSGVGCGYYDERGAVDGAGIARLMNEYMFGVCFNPAIEEGNIFHFLDHCLSHLSNPFFHDEEERGYFASKTGIPGGLAPAQMGRYWMQYGQLIRQRVQKVEQRYVFTPSYIASYHEDLAGVFGVLDELANDAALANSVPGGTGSALLG